MSKFVALALLIAIAGNLAMVSAHAEDATSAPASSAFTSGREKAHERMRTCGAEWKTAKADADVKAAGWPRFWSECNKRVKAQSN